MAFGNFPVGYSRNHGLDSREMISRMPLASRKPGGRSAPSSGGSTMSPSRGLVHQRGTPRP